MFNRFELSPVDNRKSFYGKAFVIYENGVYYCRSYDTIVCIWDDNKKVFCKTWNGYSVTTMRHVNAFMRYLGFNLGGKAFWDKLEFNKLYSISELINL